LAKEQLKIVPKTSLLFPLLNLSINGAYRRKSALPYIFACFSAYRLLQSVLGGFKAY